MSQTSDSDTFNLELGDIIKINAPEDTNLDQKEFFINYIDNEDIELVSDTINITLQITDGELENKDIEAIEILSRATESGYARQNGLIPNEWITIVFDGDNPIIINGLISDLQNDMIEITTYPDNKKIYIDFEYKGIPKKYPIESIREWTNPKLTEKKELDDDILLDENINIDIEDKNSDDISDDIDDKFMTKVPDVTAQIKELLIEGDNIVFGEELGEITEFIDVPESERRYSIEIQTNDLLDELLSTIPTSQRTPRVLNGIHTMINRYKELRIMFSTMSNEGEIIKAKSTQPDFKPLVERLDKLNKKLYWILPIIKNTKKVYNIDKDEEEEDVDIVNLKLSEVQNSISELFDQYTNNEIPLGQNKYKTLFTKLNPFLTPFEQPTNFTNVIADKQVNNNIITIVNNFDDFYSSVFANKKLRRGRFITSEYNLGLKQLHSTEFKGPKYNPKITSLTKNDSAAITGLLMLKKQALKYSHINLPNTTLLEKVNLNLVNFGLWKVLKKNSIVNNQIIKNSDKIEFIPKTFLTNINSFQFQEQEKIVDRNDKSYQHFLNNIIPQTGKIFELIKSSINNGNSYLKIIKHLAPFLVFSSDITYKLYENIIDFMWEQNIITKQKITENIKAYRKFLIYKFGDSSVNPKNNILNILQTVKDNEEIEKEYTILSIGDNVLSTSEAIKNIIVKDGGKLLTSALVLSDIDLYQPINVDELISHELNIINGKIEEEKPKSEECKNYTIAKYYIDIEELRQDDGNPNIYFDKKYDDTRYDIIEEFATQKETMEPLDFKVMLLSHLLTNVGLTEIKAQREAAALITGKRIIRDGDYAYILDPDHNYLYFVRENDNWKRDDEISGMKFDSTIFCNLKNTCISIKKNCNSMQISKTNIKKNLLKDILNTFDEKFYLSIENIKKTIVREFNYNKENLKRITTVTNENLLFQDNKRMKIANTLEINDIVVSPYLDLLNSILSQNDFVKKQANIIQFTNQYTRVNSPENSSENIFWFYCNETNIPLLPTFYTQLAIAFQSGNYQRTLNEIKRQRGKMSDDGDKIVDKYSGFVICAIDLDESEGFDDSGFKVVTRSIIEKDLVQKIELQDFKIPETREKRNSTTIINIIKTMDANLHISIDSEIEFIINTVNYTMDLLVRKVERKGTKISQKDYNKYLILSTLSTYLIAIQTTMPSITTRHTFPGCVHSFKGYPLINKEDEIDGLTYIACVALKLRSNTEPWARLPKLKRKHKDSSSEIILKLVSQFKSIITRILENQIVKTKLEDKRRYLKTYKEVERIPQEFNVKKWLTFLPPLKPIKITRLEVVPKEFIKRLDTMFISGNSEQFKNLSILKSKIFYFSLHIQELIQRVVNKHSILLKNVLNDPLVENSCCNNGSKITLQYFVDGEPNIILYNRNVKKFSAIYNYSQKLFKSHLLFDPKNTRLIFPPISDTFSEITIYKAFIKFCGFNTGIELNEDLSHLCISNESKFNSTDDISEKIKILKSEGKIYSSDSFYQLLTLINKENIIHIDFNPIIITSVKKVEQLTNNIILRKNLENLNLLNEIPDIIKSIFDSYDTTIEDNDERIIEANNKLDEFIKFLMNKIIKPFFEKNGVSQKYFKILDNIEKLKARGEDTYLSREEETNYAESIFIQQEIDNIISIFPSIILNKVDYSNLKIPKHWNLTSSIIQKDIKNISKELQLLKTFYSMSNLNPILSDVMKNGNYLLELLKSTPFYANIRVNPGEKRSSTLLNGKLLVKFMKFYFLYAINLYIISLNKDLPTISGTPVLQESPLDIDIVESLILEGDLNVLSNNVAKLITTMLDIISKTKKVINLGDNEMKVKIRKAKEKEKSKITTQLGDLTEEELQVEDLLKNHRIGRWNLGQTKALYVFNDERYEKERAEIEKDALDEMKLGGVDDVTASHQNIFLLEGIEEQVAQQQELADANSMMRALPEDDDFGDADGDEMF